MTPVSLKCTSCLAIVIVGFATVTFGLNCYQCGGCDEVKEADSKPCEVSENLTALCLTDNQGDDVIRSCSSDAISKEELNGEVTGCALKEAQDKEGRLLHTSRCFCSTANCNGAFVDIGNVEAGDSNGATPFLISPTLTLMALNFVPLII